MKVAFTTLGCRTNQNDTAEMQTVLEREGFAIVDPREEADIYVVNTCTVTAKSDYNSRLAVKKSLAINEAALVVFTGCYAQLNPEEAAQLPGLDVVLGNADKLQIGEVIRRRLADLRKEDAFGLPLMQLTDITQAWDFKPIPVSDFHGRTKAFIKVQTGCDEACSFCTVASARGRSISDSRANILHIVREAVASGYREITLTGINLGTWGRDLSPAETFSSLVRDIVNLPGEFRVRLSSINPMEIDDDLIDLMARHEKLCPHFHVPLQSGDSHVLEKMRRNYRVDGYRRTLERILERVPEPGLGADVIVGFPGETDAMFENTRALLEEFPFTYLHVFSYSPRRGTTAYSLKNDVPGPVKKERQRTLSALGEEKAQVFRSKFLGKEATLLVENSREPRTGRLRGHTERYIPVAVDGGGEWLNQLAPIRIEQVADGKVSGCLL